MSKEYTKAEKAALKKSLAISGVIAIVIILVVVFAPNIRATVNNWKHDIQKADDATNYATRKEVEDTCRAYIASYEADKITYDTNKKFDSIEAQELANAARTRANRTAATYNTYYLQNSYVWEDNIPSDIKAELPYITE